MSQHICKACEQALPMKKTFLDPQGNQCTAKQKQYDFFQNSFKFLVTASQTYMDHSTRLIQTRIEPFRNKQIFI